MLTSDCQESQLKTAAGVAGALPKLFIDDYNSQWVLKQLYFMASQLSFTYLSHFCHGNLV